MIGTRTAAAVRDEVTRIGEHAEQLAPDVQRTLRAVETAAQTVTVACIVLAIVAGIGVLAYALGSAR